MSFFLQKEIYLEQKCLSLVQCFVTIIKQNEN